MAARGMFSGRAAMGGFSGRGAMQPTVPLEPEDAKDRAKAVVKKRLNDDTAEYFVEYESDEKESAWVERDKLIRKPSSRPLVNQFESELLEQVKLSIEQKVQADKRMPLTDLAAWMTEQYPTFQMSIHKVRNMTVFLRSRMRDTVKIADGCAISAAEEAKLREQEQKEKKNLLLDGYISLIECVRSMGATKMSRLGIMFNARNPGFKSTMRTFGFLKFKDFVDSCPGVWVDPNHKPGGRLAVELRNERPPELAERMKELEASRGSRRDYGGGGRDRYGGGGRDDRGYGRGGRDRGGGGRPAAGGGRRSRSNRGRRRSRSRDRRPKRRSRSRSRKRKRSNSRGRKKRSRSRSNKKKKRSRSRSKSKAKKKKRSRSSSSSSSGGGKKKEAPLPHPWEQVIDPKTKKWYYWNPDTDETSWERPTK